MDKSTLLLNVVGFALCMFAWFNPVSIGILLRVSIFILGFDMMDVLLKVAVFALGFFFPVFGETFGTLSWSLLVMLGAELAIMAFDVERPYYLTIKPLSVFVVALLSLGLLPALVLGGVDLVVNLSRRMRPKKRRSKK